MLKKFSIKLFSFLNKSCPKKKKKKKRKSNQINPKNAKIIGIFSALAKNL